jgi:2-haloacid dehalogenase
LETLGIDKPGLRDRLMNLYLTLDAFPEVTDVLAGTDYEITEAEDGEQALAAVAKARQRCVWARDLTKRRSHGL